MIFVTRTLIIMVCDFPLFTDKPNEPRMYPTNRPTEWRSIAEWAQDLTRLPFRIPGAKKKKMTPKEDL